MDESLRHLNPNPTLSASFLSKGFFWWLNPLFNAGRSRPLEIDDMYNVCPEDSSEKLGTDLEREWEKELKKKDESGGKVKPSLLKALWRLFGLRYMLLGIIVFIEEGVRVAQPLLLGGLIRYFTPNSITSVAEAYLYAMGVSLCAIMLAVAHHPYFFGVTRMGMQMRVACCSLMYKKALRLSNSAMGQTTVGQIVNLMSNDVNRFDQAVIFLHFLWIGPLQALAVLVILWYELGPSVLAGFAVLLLLIPVQGSMGRLFSKLRRKTAVHTDERVKVMNEIIAGMRVIKMYCWEKPFGEIVEKIRSQEIVRIRNARFWQALMLAPNFFSIKLILFLTFLAFSLAQGSMTPESVFITIALYQAIRVPITVFMPFAVQNISEIRVCFERLQKFLLLEELEKTTLGVTKSELRPKPEDCSIRISKLCAKWNEELDNNTLINVSASVKAGELLAVIGPVGAGKSSLLMAILGELPVLSGQIDIKGKIAYVSQQAWVFSGSLRQNVLFGCKYDKARFDKVIKASAMHKDLEIMPFGDSTLIGDRGVSLSGGQRARLSLARALYSDADIFLLDDPLSAVDAAVGRHIFDKCIQGVLRNKPRILVTHQLQYLKDADTILILKEGEGVGKGTYEELSNSGIDFAELLKSNEENEEEKAQLSPIGDHAPVFVQNYTSTVSLASAISDFEPEPVQLPEEEERAKGTVGMKVYVEYFKAGAGCFKFFLLVLFNLIAQCTYIMSDWWLSRWSNSEEERLAAIQEQEHYFAMGYNETNVTIPYVDSHLNIYIFTGIIMGVFTFGMVRALLFFKVAVDASQKLHNTMFTQILRSRIGFFDTNPVGRILNRFAKDVGHMDDNLPITFFDFIQCFLQILGIVLVSGFVNPWVFIPTVPIIILFVWIRQYYLSTARSIKRLEGTTRSPVFSYLSASLQGLHTIRAFSMEQKCMDEFDAHQDLHSEAWFLFLSTSRWLAVRLDWLCAIFVTAVTFCCVFAAGTLDAGLVGLSITYSMMLMGLFQWGVRQSAEVENQMISVERVLEYSRLPSEAALDSEEKKKPSDSWPDKGAIQADNVCLQYFPTSPMVLKNLTFRIKEKEKVGIVGRTGAGKSSLITCLFRLVEPSGSLNIDGIDILSLGLHDLRKVISIIPQDPVLFTGTLRKNLDPFLNHADEQLWRALTEVQLKEAIEELPAGLETSVSEGGVNFSVGQRQLICLARAILRHNRILLIDEATANVDPKTDELIQETIRDKFCDCTVLTIAHRLHTIMDSDRVMVLSEGKIMEFEPPHLLLQRKSGMFYDMVQQVGKTDADFLATMAADAYNSRYSKENAYTRRRHAKLEKLAAADKAENVGKLDEIVVPDEIRLSLENNTDSRAKVNRSPKKLSVLDEVNLNAPLALAESFHSLLKHTSENGEEMETDLSSAVNEQNVPLLSANTMDNAGRARAEVSPDKVSTLTVPVNGPQINSLQKITNASPLKDTSLEDDVFEDDKQMKSASVTSQSTNGATTDQNTDGNSDGSVEGNGSKIANNTTEDEEEGAEFDSNLLQRDESGIGTDVNGSCSDTDENTSNTAGPLDTPAADTDALLLSTQQHKGSIQTDALPHVPSDEAVNCGPQVSNKQVDDASADKFEDEAEGASETDVLILPASQNDSTSSVRS